jgi:hypothetical protein
MKELLSSVADKYIVSNISMFSNNNKIYIYDNYGNAKEIGECSFSNAAQQIAYYCLDNDIEFVQIYGNGLFLGPIAKMITKEVDKQGLNFANKNLKVKVTVG